MVQLSGERYAQLYGPSTGDRTGWPTPTCSSR
jgi:hypothetical protein